MKKLGCASARLTGDTDEITKAHLFKVLKVFAKNLNYLFGESRKTILTYFSVANAC
jgi:hypothetical protein